MRQFLLYFTVIVSVNAAPWSLSAGLYPDDAGSDSGAKDYEPGSLDLQHMYKSLNASFAASGHTNAFASASDPEHPGNGEFSYFVDPGMELLFRDDGPQNSAPSKDQLNPDSESVNLWLDRVYASIEADYLSRRQEQLERQRQERERRKEAAQSKSAQSESPSGSLPWLRPSDIIPEPTALTYLSIVGISFAAGRFRRRRKRSRDRMAI